ncbi:MAG: hypothetical protein LBP75_06565 [Planctomycetota bacterium]|nr:hypothetical protein [Planctomycetota bacterium]
MFWRTAFAAGGGVCRRKTARRNCRIELSINRHPGWRRKERAPYPGLIYFAPLGRLSEQIIKYRFAS